eukprot:COSAG01_NODE_758_length_13805_cov_23.267912_3_plen_91_part_00
MALLCTCQGTCGVSLGRLQQLLLLSAAVFCGLHGALLAFRLAGDNQVVAATTSNNLRGFTGANASDVTASSATEEEDVRTRSVPTLLLPW